MNSRVFAENAAEKIKHSKCVQETADLITFTEEILTGKLHLKLFLHEGFYFPKIFFYCS